MTRKNVSLMSRYQWCVLNKRVTDVSHQWRVYSQQNTSRAMHSWWKSAKQRSHLASWSLKRWPCSSSTSLWFGSMAPKVLWGRVKWSCGGSDTRIERRVRYQFNLLAQEWRGRKLGKGEEAGGNNDRFSRIRVWLQLSCPSPLPDRYSSTRYLVQSRLATFTLDRVFLLGLTTSDVPRGSLAFLPGFCSLSCCAEVAGDASLTCRLGERYPGASLA
jgi:hypothetical protein